MVTLYTYTAERKDVLYPYIAKSRDVLGYPVGEARLREILRSEGMYIVQFTTQYIPTRDSVRPFSHH